MNHCEMDHYKMNHCEMIAYLELLENTMDENYIFNQMVKHFTEMGEENEKLKKENKKLMKKSLKTIVKLNTENKELKTRLDASQQVNVCYAKVAGQANQIDELCSNIEVKDDWISEYMAKA